MASSEVVDLVTLLAPIAGEKPAGADLRADASPGSDYHAESVQLVGVIADRFVEVAFAWNAPRHAELAAELVLRFEELDEVPERG